MEDKITPLHWPEHNPQSSRSFFARILGEPSVASLAFEGVAHQLMTRSDPTFGTWGKSAMQIRVGRAICKVLKETYDWPNDHFIPEDPFHVAFLMPWNMRDIAEVSIMIDQELGIVTDPDELVAMSDGTLGELAKYIMTKINDE